MRYSTKELKYTWLEKIANEVNLMCKVYIGVLKHGMGLQSVKSISLKRTSAGRGEDKKKSMYKT